MLAEREILAQHAEEESLRRKEAEEPRKQSWPFRLMRIGRKLYKFNYIHWHPFHSELVSIVTHGYTEAINSTGRRFPACKGYASEELRETESNQVRTFG